MQKIQVYGGLKVDFAGLEMDTGLVQSNCLFP